MLIHVQPTNDGILGAVTIRNTVFSITWWYKADGSRVGTGKQSNLTMLNQPKKKDSPMNFGDSKQKGLCMFKGYTVLHLLVRRGCRFIHGGKPPSTNLNRRDDKDWIQHCSPHCPWEKPRLQLAVRLRPATCEKWKHSTGDSSWISLACNLKPPALCLGQPRS